MLTTIGELTNGLIEYASIIEISMCNNMPFIRALLGNGSGYTKVYIYIVQTDEHRYSVCDHYDDLGGNRYFASGGTSNPFIQERDIIRRMFSDIDSSERNEYSQVVNNLTEITFFDHLCKLLFEYRIIRFDPKLFNVPFSSIFITPKIKRNVEISFVDKRYHNGTVGDFVHMVIRDRSIFNLGNIKAKESKEILSRLKTIGIIPVIENNSITQAIFERQK